MGKNGRKNFHKALKSGLGLIMFVLILGVIPYCKDILANPSYTVTDLHTAYQPVDRKISGQIIVNFKCEEAEFPKLLCAFIESHKDLDFKVAETQNSVDSYCKSGFLVTFNKK